MLGVILICWHGETIKSGLHLSVDLNEIDETHINLRACSATFFLVVGEITQGVVTLVEHKEALLPLSMSIFLVDIA